MGRPRRVRHHNAMYDGVYARFGEDGSAAERAAEKAERAAAAEKAAAAAAERAAEIAAKRAALGLRTGGTSVVRVRAGGTRVVRVHARGTRVVHMHTGGTLEHWNTYRLTVHTVELWKGGTVVVLQFAGRRWGAWDLLAHPWQGHHLRRSVCPCTPEAACRAVCTGGGGGAQGQDVRGFPVLTPAILQSRLSWLVWTKLSWLVCGLGCADACPTLSIPLPPIYPHPFFSASHFTAATAYRSGLAHCL